MPRAASPLSQPTSSRKPPSTSPEPSASHDHDGEHNACASSKRFNADDAAYSALCAGEVGGRQLALISSFGSGDRHSGEETRSTVSPT